MRRVEREEEEEEEEEEEGGMRYEVRRRYSGRFQYADTTDGRCRGKFQDADTTDGDRWLRGAGGDPVAGDRGPVTGDPPALPPFLGGAPGEGGRRPSVCPRRGDALPRLHTLRRRD